MKDMANKIPRVFLDTNILLDYQDGRSNEVAAIESLFDASLDDTVELCIAAHSLPNIFYIIRKDYSVEERKQIVLNFNALCTVIPVNADNIEKAVNSTYTDDMEDALQIQCAIDGSCDYFLSRDVKLLKKSPVKAMLPHELAAELII